MAAMLRHALSLVASVLVLGSLACSSSTDPPGSTELGSRTPCRDASWSCPAGETCWFVDAPASVYECRKTALGTSPGAACNPTVASPTCGPGQLCLAAGGGAYKCAQYCDPSAPQCAGQECISVLLVSGVSLPFCGGGPPAPTATDAGTGVDGG